MIDGKMRWTKYKRFAHLKSAMLIRCSTINTVRSTRIGKKEGIDFGIKEYLFLKTASTPGDEIE